MYEYVSFGSPIGETNRYRIEDSSLKNKKQDAEIRVTPVI
jgi:hypothetical protein